MSTNRNRLGRLPAGNELRRLGWAALATAGRVPIVRRIAGELYRRYFNAAEGSHVRLFRGIYADFAAARRAIAPQRRESYDNAPSAQRMLGEWLNIDPSDYAVMFWLAKLGPHTRRVFDWGGNLGIKYFAYRKYLTYPAEMTWLVSDVPAVVALGEQVAARESAPALRFTTTLKEIGSADILLISGALQFIEDPFELLKACPALPKHVVLSKVPVYELASAVTLHNMGTALCPYHLFNRATLIAAVERLGFDLVDEWRSPNVGCSIPFHPGHSIAAYAGFYFMQRD